MTSSTQSISFSSTKTARAIFDALVPETQNTHEKHSKTIIQLNKNKVKFTVTGTQAKGRIVSLDTYGKLAQYLKTLIPGK